VTHHLEPVPSEPPGSVDPLDPSDAWSAEDEEEELRSPVRPAWWRWVAIAVILAMVVAGPFAYVLFKVLD
jgi:hypothetical protein